MASTDRFTERLRGAILLATLAALVRCTPNGSDVPTAPARSPAKQSVPPAAPGSHASAEAVATARDSQLEAAPRYDYTFRIDAALEHLDGELCMHGVTARWLRPQIEEAGRLLVSASAGTRALAPTRAGIAIDDLPPNSCVRYRVNVAGALQSSASSDAAVRVGRDALLSPDLWLLEPEPRDDRATVAARFELPARLAAAVPWPRDGREPYPYTVASSAFVYKSAAAFGQLEEHRIEVGARRLEIAILGEGFGHHTPRMLAHVRKSAQAAASILGRLPAPRIRLLVVPRPAGVGSFGYAVRGGGATVVLLLAHDLDADDYLANWHTTHELLHFCLPPMNSAEAWWFEGVTTYLAAVARGRAGLISERQMWWELLDGFARGRRAGTGRSLRAESAAMHRTRAYWRVYWAGAAMALQIDVGLRRHGSSLAQALATLAGKLPTHSHAWTGSEIAAEIDRVSATSVAATVVSGQLDRATFPDVRAMTHELGVALASSGHATIDPRAPAAALRAAITQRATPER